MSVASYKLDIQFFLIKLLYNTNIISTQLGDSWPPPALISCILSSWLYFPYLKLYEFGLLENKDLFIFSIQIILLFSVYAKPKSFVHHDFCSFCYLSYVFYLLENKEKLVFILYLSCAWCFRDIIALNTHNNCGVGGGFILQMSKVRSGLPWWLSSKEFACQCRRPGFDSWVRKICWRRQWQPTPVFLPGNSHGQRSLVGYTPWDHRESDTTTT